MLLRRCFFTKKKDDEIVRHLRVGRRYQAQIPKFRTGPYKVEEEEEKKKKDGKEKKKKEEENKDEDMWNPVKLSEEEVDDYLIP
ncbi:hypothetical protein CEXT_422761 [Caerostris extrusa]|uniref:ELM2 domain-containing protein n=1 Tax=Caerostris extrusa TaxID=172846 RepID=A0AAV4RFW9_CAEEX|nr:hypothetical protein CEXT_422761 [Caerostris extrusa]